MTIEEKLFNIQTQIKVSKSNYNSFGKYNYRSCEDILETLKPFLIAEKSLLHIKDEIELIGEHTYVQATVKLISLDDSTSIETKAYARECKHTGMSEDQCTGTASSYARKYALNAMFLLDDSEDADSDAEQLREKKAKEKADAEKAKMKKAKEEQKAKIEQEKAAQEAKEKEPLTCQKCGKSIPIPDGWTNSKMHNWFISNNKGVIACSDCRK